MMNNNSNHSNSTSNSTDTGSGYASDEENPGESEAFTSYLNGMFDSEDEQDDDSFSTASKEVMPPPPRALTTAAATLPTAMASSLSCNSSPSDSIPETGYTSCSPLTSSGTESPPSSDEERWELHYLTKKRRLLTMAVSLMNREEDYNAHMALQLSTRQTFDTPLWQEAKRMANYTEVKPQHSNMHQRSSILAGTKRPRIDLSCVYHVKQPRGSHVGDDLLRPQLCTVESKNVGTVVSSEEEEEESVSDGTMDLEHAIAFTPIAQVLAQVNDPFTIVHANRAFSELSGLTTDQVVGRALSSIVINDDDTILGTAQDTFMNANIKTATTSAGNRKCVMRQVLVKEAKSHKKVVSFGDSTKKEAPAVTHVLVQLKSPTQAIVDSKVAQPKAPMTTRKSTRKRANSRVMETVG